MLQVASLIAEHMVTEVEAHQLASDAAAAQVWKGAEDGRLLRILVRLTSILERPESDGDPQWAETGPPAALQPSSGGSTIFHKAAAACLMVFVKADVCMGILVPAQQMQVAVGCDPCSFQFSLQELC